MNTDDIEWNTIIGSVEITKQKRRKHYVVYNSLPLSRDTDIEEFQHSNEKAQPCGLHTDPISNILEENSGRERDKCVLEACVRSTKPLLPISIFRSMIETPKLARMTVPGRVVREEINPTMDVALGRLRNKPGSGFDCLAGSEQTDSSSGRGVLDMAVPLSSVPKTIYGQLNIQISEVGTLDSQPPSSLIHSTFTAEYYAANDSIAYHEEPLTTRLKIIHQGSELRGLTQAELLLRDSYELPQLQINTSSEKCTVPVLNCTDPSYGDSRGDPIPKLTVEAPPIPHFSLGRVASDIGGRSKGNDFLSQGSVDGEDTEEEEPTLPVSRRLFTPKPESNYFSMAQRCLNSSSGAINYNSLDYLRRPTRRALQFPTVNEAINEEDERSINEEEEDEDEEIIVRNTNLAPARVGLSRQRSIATTPITLKELLNLSGRRRTSISGIFHKKGVESVKQFEKYIPYPDGLPSSHKASLILASSPISSPIGSKPLSVYASRRTSTKVHRPYVSPLGRPSEPKETMEVRRPVGKLKRGVTMAAGAETATPVRKRFKPPLLKSRAETLLPSGNVGTLPKRSWTNALEEDRDLGSAAESQIDLQSISSFRAVQKAW